MRFRAVTPTSRVNCTDIIRVKPEQPAYDIFSTPIKRRFQQSKTRTPLQGNLCTRLQYRVYTPDNFFAFSVSHLKFFFYFFFARIFHRFLPESEGGATALPRPRFYAHVNFFKFAVIEVVLFSIVTSKTLTFHKVV